MDGYSAMTMLAKQRPEYVPVVKKCVEAHRKEEQKKHQLGFEWGDVGVWPIKLMRLATDYDLLTITYKSNSATCYMVKDIEGVERALQDVAAGRIAASVEGGMALRVWLSATTVKKLKTYTASEFPECWDAEGLVVERALNLFLDEATVCSSVQTRR